MNTFNATGQIISKVSSFKSSVREIPYSWFIISIERPYRSKKNEPVCDCFICKAIYQAAEYIKAFCKKGTVIELTGHLERYNGTFYNDSESDAPKDTAIIVIQKAKVLEECTPPRKRRKKHKAAMNVSESFSNSVLEESEQNDESATEIQEEPKIVVQTNDSKEQESKIDTDFII